jgi:hypothetical protein
MIASVVRKLSDYFRHSPTKPGISFLGRPLGFVSPGYAETPRQVLASQGRHKRLTGNLIRQLGQTANTRAGYLDQCVPRAPAEETRCAAED